MTCGICVLFKTLSWDLGFGDLQGTHFRSDTSPVERACCAQGCARLHGYYFAVRISVARDVGNNTGLVMDFSDIGAAMKPLLKRPDPRYLNEIDGMENQTGENLAR